MIEMLVVFCFLVCLLCGYVSVHMICDNLKLLVLEVRITRDWLDEMLEEDQVDSSEEWTDCDPADDWKKKVPES